jgi:hypothetical protein
MLGEFIEDRNIVNKLDFNSMFPDNEKEKDTVSQNPSDQDKPFTEEEERKAEERLNNILAKYSNSESATKEPPIVIKQEDNFEDYFTAEGPKRLKKTILIQKEKKIKKLLNLNAFFEYEAELGSDNEQHDDIVKKVDHDDNDYLDEYNEDLKDLIADEFEEDKEDIKEKYFNDMLDKDKEELKKVIQGPELRMKRARTDIKMDPDYLPLDMRLKKFKSNDESLYSFNENILFRNFESLQQKINEDEGENDELKEMYQTYENNVIKKITEKSKEFKDHFNNRNIENNKILENVINLNQKKKEEVNVNNVFFKKGTTIRPIGSSVISQINLQKFGEKFNKNSLLYAMKNDKYYSQGDYGSEGLVKEGSGLSDKTAASAGDKQHAYFSANLNLKSALNNKSNNLSSLFKNNNSVKSINESRRIEQFNSSGKKSKSLKKILN